MVCLDEQHTHILSKSGGPGLGWGWHGVETKQPETVRVSVQSGFPGTRRCLVTMKSLPNSSTDCIPVPELSSSLLPAVILLSADTAAQSCPGARGTEMDPLF